MKVVNEANPMFNSEVFQASAKALGSKDFTAEASIYNSICLSRK